MKANERKKKYKWSDIAWRDLNLIPIALVGLFIFSYAGLALGWLYFGHISELQLAMIGTLGQLMAYVVVIFVFYFYIYILLVKDLRRDHISKKRWFIIIIVFLIALGLSNLYDYLMQFYLNICSIQIHRMKWH